MHPAHARHFDVPIGFDADPMPAAPAHAAASVDKQFRPSAELQDDAVKAEVADCLVVDFGHFRSTHKVIANAAGASSKTAENWTRADRAPSLTNFLRLLPHSPSLRKMVLRIIGLEGDCSPQFQLELSELLRRYRR